MATRSAKNQLATGGGPSTELKHRLLFVLVALIIYRIGSFIPVPGIDPAALELLFEQQRGTILDMFNMFSGGALGRFSVFAIGIMPYISASIIMQLLSHVDPRLKAATQGGRARAQKDYSVHPLRYRGPRHLSGAWRCHRAGRTTGRGLASGAGPRIRVSSDHRRHAGHRDHILDVAG